MTPEELSKLEQDAFPEDHPTSYRELRDFYFLGLHIRDCSLCQSRLEVIKAVAASEGFE